MKKKEFTISYSEIDQNRFGYKTAKAFIAAKQEIEKTLTFCYEKNIEFLIARCETNNLKIVQGLEDEGFKLMDTLIYYRFNLITRDIKQQNPPYLVRKASSKADADQVARVAEKAFKNYFGHYHADSRLDQKSCDAVYADWAYRSCLDRSVADSVFVSETDGSIDGFATFKIHSEEVEGVLFGIVPEAQHRGRLQVLIKNGLQWCKEKNISSMITSTQIQNYAVQKVWVRMGFEPYSSFYTFHKWF